MNSCRADRGLCAIGPSTLPSIAQIGYQNAIGPIVLCQNNYHRFEPGAAGAIGNKAWRVLPSRLSGHRNFNHCAGVSVAVAYATYGVIARGNVGQRAVRLFGTNSGASYSVLTTAVSAGPAEDLFFIGVLQYTIAGYVGWLAVPIYLVVISSAHYCNVVQGLESKMDFTRMLPARLGISLLITISFQLTGSLIYGLFIHNFFNTCALGAFRAGYRARNTASPLYPDMAEI
ncbi:MAG: CPBP family intramembrane metalloprotease [Firmicutes bacterium]|nr:CPBP family intramembrane metalloprotease [Bacillota bacterium]